METIKFLFQQAQAILNISSLFALLTKHPEVLNDMIKT